jgi:hypothetical protein
VLLTPSGGGEEPHAITAYGTASNRVILGGNSTYTNSPMSYFTSGLGYSQYSNADPLGFQVNTSIAAAIDLSGMGTTWSSVDGVGTWFVLSGGSPGDTVGLTVDIAFQGQISVAGDTSTAAFTNYLGFVSSTTSTTYEYVVVQNGVIHPQGSSTPDLTGTVDDFVNNGLGTYEINEVIRSKVFNVTVGTPFRLALVLNTSAGPNHAGDSALIDFDPGISSLYFPDGFALADGTPLGVAGYSVHTPLPASFLLLGSGLMSLWGWRRLKQN